MIFIEQYCLIKAFCYWKPIQLLKHPIHLDWSSADDRLVSAPTTVALVIPSSCRTSLFISTLAFSGASSTNMPITLSIMEVYSRRMMVYCDWQTIYKKRHHPPESLKVFTHARVVALYYKQVWLKGNLYRYKATKHDIQTYKGAQINIQCQTWNGLQRTTSRKVMRVCVKSPYCSFHTVASRILVWNVTVDDLYFLSSFLYCELRLFVKLLVKSSINHWGEL